MCNYITGHVYCKKTEEFVAENVTSTFGVLRVNNSDSNRFFESADMVGYMFVHRVTEEDFVFKPYPKLIYGEFNGFSAAFDRELQVFKVDLNDDFEVRTVKRNKSVESLWKQDNTGSGVSISTPYPTLLSSDFGKGAIIYSVAMFTLFFIGFYTLCTNKQEMVLLEVAMVFLFFCCVIAVCMIAGPLSNSYYLRKYEKGRL